MSQLPELFADVSDRSPHAQARRNDRRTQEYSLDLGSRTSRKLRNGQGMECRGYQAAARSRYIDEFWVDDGGDSVIMSMVSTGLEEYEPALPGEG